MTLLEARKGSRVRILEIPDDRARAQCIRFGIGEGTVVDWAEPLRVGPVVVRQANQEICLGRNLAGRILVEEAAPHGECGLDVRGRRA
ncbi:MAG: ferrous iron transport protein A [Thermoleophilia bacterium]|nr:ferrous iron transport protein A [Thermoleophilia bacterium]